MTGAGHWLYTVMLQVRDSNGIGGLDCHATKPSQLPLGIFPCPSFSDVSSACVAGH